MMCGRLPGSGTWATSVGPVRWEKQHEKLEVLLPACPSSNIRVLSTVHPVCVQYE